MWNISFLHDNSLFPAPSKGGEGIVFSKPVRICSDAMWCRLIQQCFEIPKIFKIMVHIRSTGKLSLLWLNKTAKQSVEIYLKTIFLNRSSGKLMLDKVCGGLVFYLLINDMVLLDQLADSHHWWIYIRLKCS